jgi:molybdate transport system substrate-binding protein
MYKLRPSPPAVIFAIAIVLALPTSALAQIRVLMSGGFRAAYQELLPQFENTTGITVTTAAGPSQGDGPNTIAAQLRRGVPADVVIMSREGLAELFKDGRIAPGSDVDLARVSLGVGVRAGGARPDIGTVDAFKQAVLHANSIGIQSTSAIYLKTTVFPRLGIVDAMAGKLSSAGAANVANGEAEMVILPISEILPVPGVDFVSAIPSEIQLDQVFAAAVLKGANDPEAAKRLIAFLASEKTTLAVEATGMKRTRLR